MTTLQKLDQITLDRKDVLVDDSINSRQFIDEDEIKRLAGDIKARGVVLHPPIVMRASQAGDRFEDEEAPFVLVVGFRRQKALDLLEVSETAYSIAPKEWTLEDAQMANLAENLAREDLSSYELAMACARLKEEHGYSGEECAERIAKAVKATDHDTEGAKALSGQHVNNLIRCTTLPDPILKAWKEGHPAATLRNMLSFVKLDTEAAQLEAWERIVNPNADKGDGGDGTGKGGKGNARRDRPSADACLNIIDAVKASDHSDDWKEGAIAALKWASGGPTLPGVEVATPPAKAKKGAKGKKAAKAKKSAKGAKGGKKAGKANGAGESPAASPA